MIVPRDCTPFDHHRGARDLLLTDWSLVPRVDMSHHRRLSPNLRLTAKRRTVARKTRTTDPVVQPWGCEYITYSQRNPEWLLAVVLVNRFSPHFAPATRHCIATTTDTSYGHGTNLRFFWSTFIKLPQRQDRSEKNAHKVAYHFFSWSVIPEYG